MWFKESLKGQSEFVYNDYLYISQQQIRIGY